jgi:hypothetical protein
MVIPNAMGVQLVLYIIRAYCEFDRSNVFALLKQYAIYNKQKPVVINGNSQKKVVPVGGPGNTYFETMDALLGTSQKARTENKSRKKIQRLRNNNASAQYQQVQTTSNSNEEDEDQNNIRKPRYITQHSSTVAYYMRRFRSLYRQELHTNIAELPLSNENKVFLGIGVLGLINSVKVVGMTKLGRFVDYKFDEMLGQRKQGKPPSFPVVSANINRRMALLNSAFIAFAYRDRITSGFKELVDDDTYEIMSGGELQDGEELELFEKVDRESEALISKEIDLMYKAIAADPILQEAYQFMKVNLDGNVSAYRTEPIFRDTKELINNLYHMDD